MILIKEDRKPIMDTISAFQRIVELFCMISVSFNQLERTLAILNFSEGYLGEGTIADRRFVQEKIIELQSYTTELDKIYFFFKQEDIQTSFEQKQYELNKANVPVSTIRKTMISILSMQKSGITDDDNKKIKELIGIMFTNVNKVIKDIQNYVKVFNKKSARKLVFNVKWTPLPK